MEAYGASGWSHVTFTPVSPTTTAVRFLGAYCACASTANNTAAARTPSIDFFIFTPSFLLFCFG